MSMRDAFEPQAHGHVRSVARPLGTIKTLPSPTIEALIPDFDPPAPHLHKGYHGVYPQAARIVKRINPNIRTGSPAFWDGIRIIHAIWQDRGQMPTVKE